MQKLILSTLLIVSSCFITIAQSKKSTAVFKISAAEAHEDLTILQEEMHYLHAGLYTFTPKATMDRFYSELKAEITDSITNEEFYRKLLPLHGLIMNGHTMIRPSEQLEYNRLNTLPLFPLDTYWDKGNLYLLRNTSNNLNLKDGSRIDSINGEDASEVFRYLASQWTRDGYNTTFPEEIAGRAFGEFYTYMKSSPSSFDLVLTEVDGSASRVNLEALPTPILDEHRLARYGKIDLYWEPSMGDPITLDIKEGVAVLAIKTCSKSDFNKLFRKTKKLMNQLFQKIDDENVEHLIIDIRNNGGGDMYVVAELLKHLSDHPFHLYDDTYLVTNKVKRKKLYKGSQFLLNLTGGLGLKKSEDGKYRRNWFTEIFYGKDIDRITHHPVENMYTGKIYTLTNAASFSAAGFMASALQAHTSSVFIGEEPGGGTNTISAGEYLDLELPHSKNIATLALVAELFNNPKSQTGRGVIPDYPVRNSIQDMLVGHDRVMDFTLKLVQDQKSE